ncbi:MAG: hypothetical protein HOP12_02360 [Candidatus Eisenbacteria bacterium]|uniref:RiboL-PSP-HEPN domain-containing protein n=1 Tax=Eiseniibacteriota bacterium TaxID=2212470 RepID=A0A849SHF5_UNCEI|nr:hypothetical protein [Candidatus Eisenbacteria bacterium]
MTGRAEVQRLQQRLDGTFARASGLIGVAGELELLSDHARYLCVLVSGFFEQAVIELVLEHARRNAGKTIQRYVEARTRRLTNLNTQRLLDVVADFDPDWRRDLAAYVVDEKKAALDSIVALRNTISHGRPTSVTLNTVKKYYAQIKDVVGRVADLCVPV